MPIPDTSSVIVAPIDWRVMPEGHEKRHAYMASREWALLKKRLRLRCSGNCEHCKTAKYQETHHRTYARLYRERLDDLQAVCGPCHKYLSGVTDENPCAEATEPFTCNRCNVISFDPVGWYDKRRPICEGCAMALEAGRESK